jgi:Protein of unknown function (DUF1236)
MRNSRAFILRPPVIQQQNVLVNVMFLQMIVRKLAEHGSRSRSSRAYEVVDVIDQGYWRGSPQVAELRLSSSQIAFVRDSIPRDFPESPIRLRLALGAEIPADVELYELPRIVIDRVPGLWEFRFLVADEQIVIVDPRDHSIAFMIDR